jgi:hypothetical protein
MPGRKNDNMKKRRTNKNRVSVNNSLTKRVKNLESAVRAEETKKKYEVFNEVPMQIQTSNLPIWTLINSIQPGDGANNINGISYINQGISYKFLVHNTSGVPAIFRMAILRLKSGQVLDGTGPDLFTGTASLGIDFSSTSEQQRYYYPFNTKKYDVVLQDNVKLGAKNSLYTEQFSSNQIISGYKPFKNRKEFIDDSIGNMNTSYYLVAFCVPAAMDGDTGTVELTGQTIMYYKDN